MAENAPTPPACIYEAALTGRQRGRLRRARERGYLNARGHDNHGMVRAYEFWCWWLKIPVLWYERRTPYSKFGRIHLDMSTTLNTLTAEGQAAMAALGASQVSAHDVCWERVPLADIAQITQQALRAALHKGNAEPNRMKLINITLPRPAKVLTMVARAASA